MNTNLTVVLLKEKNMSSFFSSIKLCKITKLFTKMIT